MADSNTLDGKKVFVVEDDLFLAGMLTKRLSETGSLTMHAVNGEEALKNLAKETPDILLLDLMLPGKVDGFGVLESIKKDERLKSIPVVILSNLNRPEDIDRGMRLGAFRYLVKASILPNEIVDHLSAALASTIK
jgi:two-component system, chemotaxis family, sensor kinase CheA